VSRESSWRVITVRTEPQGRKVRPITDVTSTALRKEEMAVCLKEGAVCHVDMLLGNDHETSNCTTAIAK
jgi:hypothetical protein